MLGTNNNFFTLSQSATPNLYQDKWTLKLLQIRRQLEAPPCTVMCRYRRYRLWIEKALAALFCYAWLKISRSGALCHETFWVHKHCASLLYLEAKLIFHPQTERRWQFSLVMPSLQRCTLLFLLFSIRTWFSLQIFKWVFLHHLIQKLMSVTCQCRNPHITQHYQ